MTTLVPKAWLSGGITILLKNRFSAIDIPSRIAHWILSPGGPKGLSRDLSRTLTQAAEQLLSSQLTPVEVRAVCRASVARLHRLPTSDRTEICNHLQLLDRLVPLLGRAGRRFDNLSPAMRRRCLQACERSRWPVLSEGQAKLRHLVQMAYMECPEVWPAPGEAFAS
jgi:hypothetical protein